MEFKDSHHNQAYPTDLQDRICEGASNIIGNINPRLTKLFFVTRLQGGVIIPSLDFPNRTPYEIDFGINR